MKRQLSFGALVGAILLAVLPTTSAHAATTITPDLGAWVQAGETADFGFELAGTTGEDLIVTIELAEGTMSLDDTGLALALQPGSLSFTDVVSVTFTGSSADVATALAERLTWTAPATSSQSYLRLSLSVGSYYAGSFVDATSGHRYLQSSGSLSWAAARDAAAALTYNGLTGYLATVTTSGENSFLTAQTGGVTGYIAATSEITYVNPLLAPEDQYANESELRGVYYWGAGPEAGERVTYIPWFPDEPNGVVNDRCLLTNWNGATALWNDGGCGGAYRYLVEFGGVGTDTGPALYDNLAAGPPPLPQPELAATGVEPMAGLIGGALLLGLGMLALAVHAGGRRSALVSSTSPEASIR